MIPTIETIVNDLITGRMKAEVAIAYLYEHLKLAGSSDDDGLRDTFALGAMTGILANTDNDADKIAEWAYHHADAMMKARSKP